MIFMNFDVDFRAPNLCVVMGMWWAKPQVHGFTKVVKREYRSNRELFNLIYF